ncbi:SGNH/GDSL hydrolase family protein [Streptomyces sp. NBC_00648]|uniref:SGNH/GDSL hydrolase family protein n=1 Tax=Streptomyces sp. NBC_00648 TaxID=2975797 RepID=UPI003252A873
MKISRITAHASAISLATALTITWTAAADATARPSDTDTAPRTGFDYVALGDSYSAGLGSGGAAYSEGEDSCRRPGSMNAYPALWHAAHPDTSLDFEACSGAKTDDVINEEPRTGQHWQLGNLSEATRLVSLTIGGNDIGFKHIGELCGTTVDALCSRGLANAQSIATYDLPNKLDMVYDAIRAKAPNARVVVLGYPTFYKDDGTGCHYPSLKKKTHDAIDATIKTLNTTIENRVKGHSRFTFASVDPYFAGHQVCSGAPWLNTPPKTSLKESYHPSAEGQRYGYLRAFTKVVGRVG